ncbi:MAG: hypothetical protein WAM70_15600 [Pyrinomonadaceae bacterium]
MSAVNQKREAAAPKLVPVAEKPVTTRTSRIQVPWRRVGIYVVVALGLVLLGAVPMWVAGWQNAAEREAAQHELRLSQLENRLSAAVINARRGDYEPARQTASDFFTSLRDQIDRDAQSDLSASQREGLKPLLAQRDDIITLLARNDPAAADRLSDIYAAYRKTMNGVPQTG